MAPTPPWTLSIVINTTTALLHHPLQQGWHQLDDSRFSLYFYYVFLFFSINDTSPAFGMAWYGMRMPCKGGGVDWWMHLRNWTTPITSLPLPHTIGEAFSTTIPSNISDNCRCPHYHQWLPCTPHTSTCVSKEERLLHIGPRVLVPPLKEWCEQHWCMKVCLWLMSDARTTTWRMCVTTTQEAGPHQASWAAVVRALRFHEKSRSHHYPGQCERSRAAIVPTPCENASCGTQKHPHH